MIAVWQIYMYALSDGCVTVILQGTEIVVYMPYYMLVPNDLGVAAIWGGQSASLSQ